MTTTVKRGAGRPAASAKTSKHAQRTPLPPKPGVVADAKSAIADSQRILGEEEGTERQASYGRMTVAELHARAAQLGLEPPKRAKKGDLLTAILKKERADALERSAEAKAEAVLQTSAIDRKLDAAFGEPATKSVKMGTWGAAVTKALDSKSGAKAEAFAAEALRLEWKAEAKAYDNDRIVVTASRGEEVITIEWMGGVFQDNCTYAHNGRTPIKLRNASAAKQRMTVPPAKAAEEATKVTAHKAVRAKAGTGASGQRSGRKLPFTEASLDQEVLDALYGKRITWTNKISGLDEEDHVPAPASGTRLADGSRGVKKAHHAPRIAEGPRGREIHFVGASGFRAVLLDSITRVR